MFINFWYPAIASHELGRDQAVRVGMLGQRVAVFRDGDGVARCVADTCVHRGGSLGRGRVRKGVLECPYHGWAFGGDGRCRRIPSLGPGGAVPARAKVDAYPVEERYGIVFVFLGDLPEAERPPLMPVPEYGTDGWRSNLIVFDVKCHYERSIENGLDPAHNEYVHPTHGHEGERDDYFVPQLELQDAPLGSGFMTRFVGKERPEYAERTKMRTTAAGTFDPDVDAGTWHHGPASMVTKIHMATTNWMHQYMFECPVDEANTRVFLVNMRNCLLDEAVDQRVVQRCMDVANQDIAILEEVLPVKTPPSATREILVPADATIGRYRRWLGEWEARGWRIDTRRLREAAADGDAAFAIPCPARRGEKNWVLEAVPLVGPARGAAAGRATGGEPA